MEDEDRRRRVRSWLNAQRKEMPHGVLVHRSAYSKPPVGQRGGATYALWENEWLLYLFASEADRDEFRGRRDPRTIRDDPGDTTKVKD